MITLLVMTDGRRDCIERTIPSFLDAVDRPALITERMIHDDSGDPAYHAYLEEAFGPDGFQVYSTAGRSGFGGAIRSAWRIIRAHMSAPLIFHLEDDFVFPRQVPLFEMMEVMGLCPQLAQMALRRQPWNDAERAAGGIVEQHPDDYTDNALRSATVHHRWLEHRRFFTTNPSLYWRSLVVCRDWPDGPNSEGRFGIDLFTDPEIVSGYWGARDSGEWCEHIGAERVGVGY